MHVNFFSSWNYNPSHNTTLQLLQCKVEMFVTKRSPFWEYLLFILSIVHRLGQCFARIECLRIQYSTDPSCSSDLEVTCDPRPCPCNRWYERSKTTRFPGFVRVSSASPFDLRTRQSHKSVSDTQQMEFVFQHLTEPWRYRWTGGASITLKVLRPE